MGKTLRIYLADDKPTGILIAEIINWTGQILVGPRSQLDDLAKRKEVARTGIYCLVGLDPENPLRDRVYIGEGDNVLDRLKQHDKSDDKAFWTRTVVVVSKDENLTKSHVRHLENQLVQFTTEAKRASLANRNTPQPKLLPEPETADMDFFLEQIKMVLPVLGFSFLIPKPSVPQTVEPSSPRFVMERVGIKAIAVEIEGEFIVLKGSTVREKGAASWRGYIELRNQLLKDKKIIDDPNSDNLIFDEDTSFSSPSAAGCVICASDVNGRMHWLVEGTTKSYGQWKEEKVELASDHHPEHDKGK
ncbi:MAG: GIY-YIG nuclease family protein [Candidatus Electryonea clarkiae]|nr:GIY-YIG nuclease family protein [Candidatus Electryonea clarkiae]MDP8288455.1 GIY-YIG nuclease family protein [Candidatus Electryonea clarkiae]